MKKISLLIVIFAVMVLMNGCSTVSEKQKSMYENNALIDEAGDSYSFINRTGQTTDSKMDIQFGNFYGSQTIWSINAAKQGEIKIDFDSNVNSGKFKGVLISEGGEITNIFEGTQKGSQMVVKVSEGKYRFKIVGNNANGKAVVEFTLDKDMSSTATKQ
jgi:uncharacterized protein YceK